MKNSCHWITNFVLWEIRMADMLKATLAVRNDHFSSTTNYCFSPNKHTCCYKPILSTFTLCMLGNLSCFHCRLLIFFKIDFFEKFFQECYQCVKRFGSRPGPTFFLRRLYADDTRRERVNEWLYAYVISTKVLRAGSFYLIMIIKLPFVINIIILSIFDWLFYIGFTV